MWRQLTQKARKAIFLAHEEAELLGYGHVGSEHLLLAIIREDDCTAAMMLEKLGLDLNALRCEVMSRVTRGNEPLDDMQLAPDAKHAIDFAFDEVKLMKDDWVGTEHLLIGLTHDAGGLAAQILRNFGVDLHKVRGELRHVKAGTLPFDRTQENNGGKVSVSVI